MTYYDGLVYVDLSTVKPMIALPFHPSNAFEIDELNANLGDILREVEKEAARLTEGKDIEFSLTDKITPKGLQVQQGIIAGCSGGMYDNIAEAAADTPTKDEFDKLVTAFNTLAKQFDDIIAGLVSAGAVKLPDKK